MSKLLVVVVAISAVAAFVCFAVNVDTKDAGGITGTIEVQPDTPREHVDQTRSLFRVAGVGWVCIGILSLAWAIRRSRG